MPEMKHLLPIVPKYFKANLHTHSTITDHNVVVDHASLNEEDFLLLTGGEFGVSEPGQNALYKMYFQETRQ